MPSLIGVLDPTVDCFVSVHFLPFPSSLSKSQMDTLLGDLDIYRQHLWNCDAFRGMTKGWVMPHNLPGGPLSQLPPLSTTIYDQNTKVLMVLMTWGDAEVMKKHSSIGTLQYSTENGGNSSLREQSLLPLISSTSSGWFCYHISLSSFCTSL